MDGPIASAVVLPDEPSPPAKRRQSSVSEESAKRPRLDGDDDTGSKARRGSDADNKPAAPVRRERGRERRLFGAVLGALSQNPSTTAAQKRRSEIEKRQLAQRKQEDEESEQRKAERIARRKEQRWKEQKRFERDSMRARHDSLLNTAHFLRTETLPHLYYKPWETTDEEEYRIQDQIADARKVVERELDEYDARGEQTANRERRESWDRDSSRHAEDSNIGKEQQPEMPYHPSATNGNTNGSHNSPEDQNMDDDHTVNSRDDAVRAVGSTDIALDSTVPSHETIADDPSKDNDDDHGEDVIEEAAEDTVIY